MSHYYTRSVGQFPFSIMFYVPNRDLCICDVATEQEAQQMVNYLNGGSGAMFKRNEPNGDIGAFGKFERLLAYAECAEALEKYETSGNRFTWFKVLEVFEKYGWNASINNSEEFIKGLRRKALAL